MCEHSSPEVERVQSGQIHGRTHTRTAPAITMSLCFHKCSFRSFANNSTHKFDPGSEQGWSPEDVHRRSIPFTTTLAIAAVFRSGEKNEIAGGLRRLFLKQGQEGRICGSKANQKKKKKQIATKG